MLAMLIMQEGTNLIQDEIIMLEEINFVFLRRMKMSSLESFWH
jgi:hypothetical protein